MDRAGLNVKQIAKLAGVSTATVSRVYRGVDVVSPRMRERVQAVIDEYHYQPSPFGEALAHQRHGALGIVFPGLSGPYFAELIQGFERVAVEADVGVHIVGTHMRRETAQDLKAMARRVDGIAIHGGTVSAELVEELSRELPIVAVGAEPGAATISVRSDHDAVRALVRHLLEDHGRRSLVFVGTPDGSPDITARWSAFQQAHREVGRDAPDEPLRAGLQEFDGAQAVHAVLAGGYDAAVCANDETALGLMMATLGQGSRVPQDLAITGVDDVPLSSVVRPGLTTVARPLSDLAATAARLLLDMIAGKDVPHETILGSEMIRRGSCGCAVPEIVHTLADHSFGHKEVSGS